jgi:UDP-N-acetylglucosamine--dolichyl-phosphate N-acetylglucosaminephosphotransferase
VSVVDENVSNELFLFSYSPEGLGILGGGVYVFILVLFIPFPFANLHFSGVNIQFSITSLYDLARYLAAMLSILSMLLLGFVDDVLNLKWRYKIILPSVAVFPVLMVYYVVFGTTSVVVPLPLRPLLGGRIIDLGKSKKIDGIKSERDREKRRELRLWK